MVAAARFQTGFSAVYNTFWDLVPVLRSLVEPLITNDLFYHVPRGNRYRRSKHDVNLKVHVTELSAPCRRHADERPKRFVSWSWWGLGTKVNCALQRRY